MKKKIISLIGILTLIFTFGLSNVYAAPDDWYFEFSSRNGEALDTVWDFYFTSVLPSEEHIGGSLSMYVDPAASLVSEVLDWTGGWHGGPNPLPNDPYSGPGGYAANPGGADDRGSGYIINLTGDQGPYGVGWEAGMTARIATYTFDIATDVDFAYFYDDVYSGMGLNDKWWSGDYSVDTFDRTTSPGELWNVDGSTGWGMTPVPVPAAIWLIGSAMLCMLGINQRKKN